MDPLAPSGSSFRSRRSYPSLHHISLAPLTSRLPVDDDLEPVEYFSPRTDGSRYPYNSQSGARTSYLSSASVPTTPPLLSNSRSGSRVRQHKRSKSSNRGPLSDTNLRSLDSSRPLHHHNGSGNKRSTSSRPRLADTSGRQDSEWLLRAGLALATTTREEKGQSWLVKRESSTNLLDQEQEAGASSHYGGIGWRARSGTSTPVAASRRGSRSRGGSRKGSRADLAMTSVDVALPKFPYSQDISVTEQRDLVPDFVEEHVRSEMASIHHQDYREEDYLSSSGSETGTEDEIDELEMQRLTRERGFGLGSWIDRLVEWTLFSVDEEWPLPEPGLPDATGGISRENTHAERTISFPEVVDDDSDSQKAEDLEDDHHNLSVKEDAPTAKIEKPGEKGGWADASWLFRVAKNVVI